MNTDEIKEYELALKTVTDIECANLKQLRYAENRVKVLEMRFRLQAANNTNDSKPAKKSKVERFIETNFNRISADDIAFLRIGIESGTSQVSEYTGLDRNEVISLHGNQFRPGRNSKPRKFTYDAISVVEYVINGETETG